MGAGWIVVFAEDGLGLLAIGLLLWGSFAALSFVAAAKLRRQTFEWNGEHLKVGGLRARVLAGTEIERVDIETRGQGFVLLIRRRKGRRVRADASACDLDQVLRLANAVNQSKRYAGQPHIPAWKPIGTDRDGLAFTGTTSGIGAIETTQQERRRRAREAIVAELMEKRRRLGAMPPAKRMLVRARPWLVQVGLLVALWWGLPHILTLLGFESVHYASDPFDYVDFADAWISQKDPNAWLVAVSAGGFSEGGQARDPWNQTRLGRYAGDTDVWTYHYAHSGGGFTAVVANETGVLANWVSDQSPIPFSTGKEIRSAGQSVKGAFARQWIYKTHAAQRWGLVITDTVEGKGTTWAYFDSLGGRRQLDDNGKVKGNEALYAMLEEFRLDYVATHPGYLEPNS